MNFSAIQEQLNNDNSVFQLRKQKLILQAQKLLQKCNPDQSAIQSQNYQNIDDLKINAQHIDEQVQKIQRNATKTMLTFDNLKNQKKNIELVLNTLSSFQELNRLKNELPHSIQSKNLEQCIKLAQIFYEIEPILIKEFCQEDYHIVQNLIKQSLVTLQKEQFELGVRGNDIDLINLASGLARVLQLDQSLDKVKEIHGKELKSQLMQIEEELFGKIPASYDLIDKEYDYPFLNHFVRILELIKAEEFAENVLKYYGNDGFYSLIQYLLQEVSNAYLIGVLRRLTSFFEIDKMLKNTPKLNYENTLAQSIAKPLVLTPNQTMRLSLFCDEISAISSEFRVFLEHLTGIVAGDGKMPKLNITDTITEYLGKYLEYSQVEIQQQVFTLVLKSESLNDIWSFDKSKFMHLTKVQDNLLGNGFHEWLEELFYIIKNQIIRAINTEDPIIASAHINFIGFSVIAEDLYQISLQLFHKYLKKDYFSQSAIGLNSEYTVHNSFIILIFNIIANIPSYLKTLKSQIYGELQKRSKSQMVIGAVEEMIDSNQKKFQRLIEEKLKILSENLKGTVKSIFEEVRNLNFNTNEMVMAEQEREYTKIFSAQFKTAFKGLAQWKVQLSQENFESLMFMICQLVSKSLESIVMHKQYHQIGAIIIEKEIRAIVNYLCSFTFGNLKQAFVRLQMICETLILESYKDMEEFLNSNAIQELTLAEVKKIGALRIDLRVN